MGCLYFNFLKKKNYLIIHPISRRSRNASSLIKILNSKWLGERLSVISWHIIYTLIDSELIHCEISASSKVQLFLWIKLKIRKILFLGKYSKILCIYISTCSCKIRGAQSGSHFWILSVYLYIKVYNLLFQYFARLPLTK